MIKVANKTVQALATLFSVAAIVLFFFPFAVFNGSALSVSGLEAAFGSSVASGVSIAKSADILFCFILAVLGLVLSVFSYFSKSKVLKYVVAGDNAIVAVYMLVIALSNPFKFIDKRFTDPNFLTVTKIDYTPFVLIVALVMFAALIASVAHILISDRIEVIASKGAKKPLLKRIVGFFKDYKSETKKIVWPGFKEVCKNTGIVLVMFLVIGAIIWLVDFGLGTLIKSMWK